MVFGCSGLTNLHILIKFLVRILIKYAKSEFDQNSTTVAIVEL